MKIAFLGTPSFSLPSLQLLIDRQNDLAVFTQPDRPVDRKAILTPPPVKELALKYDIPVYQFERIRSPEGLQALQSFHPDLMITVAFGQLLSSANLAIPKYGTINVHGSLLPKYRGASPIQAAILNGDTVTGITTMFTDVGMDTGDILLSKSTPIDINETYGMLSDRLSVIGAEVLAQTLDQLEKGSLIRIPQNDSEATICHMISKTDGILDFNQSRLSVHNRVRAMNPWPCSSCFLNDEIFKIWETRIPDITASGVPGTLIADNNRLYVFCSDGPLEVLSVQVPGKKRMDAAAFLCGYSVDGIILK